MELAINEFGDDANSKTNTWHAVNFADGDVWFDTTGVGWDTSYVARFEALRATLHGVLICAWDIQYDETRAVWTGEGNCWPAAMAQCMRKSDIHTCIAFAKKHGLAVMKRSKADRPTPEAIDNGVLVLDVSWV